MTGRHQAGAVIPVGFRCAVPGAALLVVLLVAGPGLSAACPYPLGDFITDGDFHAYPAGADDPEWQVVDAVRARPQYSFGQMGYDGDTLHFAYESETDYLPPNSTVESETHIIAYKEYSHETGWNVTRQWISSEDPSVKVPPGRHVQPTLAVGRSGAVFVAWQVSGHTIGGEWWPQFGNFIVYRAKVDGAWGPIEALSPMDNGTSHRLPKSVPLGQGAYVAYQTNVGEPESTSFRVVGRTVDATGLGPLEDISPGADGFSDETVQLLTDGVRVVAVWAARNETEVAGEGEWRVWAAQRDAGGAWSEPVAVSERSKNADVNPTAGYYRGEVFVAWSTNDPAVSPGGDRSVLMRRVDLQTGAVGGVMQVTGAGSAGLDDQPALVEWDGQLQVLWTSQSSHNQTGVLVNGSDVHWRAWDGAALSPVRLVSGPDDETFKVFNPAFLVVGGALHATFIMDVNAPGSGHTHDQRQMTRLLLRGPQAYDAYGLVLYVPGAPPGGVASADLRVETTAGAPDGHWAVQMANGTWVPLPAGRVVGELAVPVDGGGFLLPTNATWCGKPVALTTVEAPHGDTGAPWLYGPWLLLLLAGVVGAAYFVGRRVWNGAGRSE